MHHAHGKALATCSSARRWIIAHQKTCCCPACNTRSMHSEDAIGNMTCSKNDTAAERCQQLHMQLRPGSTVLVHDWQYQVISSSGPATHRKSKQSGMLCTKRRFPGRNTHHPAQLNSHAGCSCVHMTLLLGPALHFPSWCWTAHAAVAWRLPGQQLLRPAWYHTGSSRPHALHCESLGSCCIASEPGQASR